MRGAFHEISLTRHPTEEGTRLWVHPGLSWVEAEATEVEIDRCLEVFTVAIAAHASFDRHDFAVQSFRQLHW